MHRNKSEFFVNVEIRQSCLSISCIIKCVLIEESLKIDVPRNLYCETKEFLYSPTNDGNND